MLARILIIEDNPANIELMVYLLNAFGYIPFQAYNGEEGVETARREVPDLIICDIHLPKMDGYGVLQQLKNEAPLRHIPVVAVTALAMVGDREKLLDAGFDGYIAKPIEPEAFIGQIEKFMRADLRSSPNPAESAAMAKDLAVSVPAKQGRILVVDDVLANREFIRSTLEPSGYEVVLADSVKRGMARVKESDFDLILCDLHMPDKYGIDFILAIKADSHLQAVPFVFISASMIEAEYQRGLQHGAVRFIQRPIEPHALLNEIKTCLEAAHG